MTKVLGIGNALVDILTMVEDESLMQALKLPKGSMQLVDGHRCNNIALATKGMRQSKASGGSAANTIHGLARLGVETAFIGHVGNDDTGHFFSSDMQQAGIKPLLFRSATPTGIANGLISPDGERTFATYLGAAIELSAAHLDEALFVGYDYLYVEGYLVQNEALLIKAMELAKTAGLKVVLDLASYNVVEENLNFLNEIIWAYDYGGKSKSNWPSKHDTILVYVKDQKKYYFDSESVDREPYMAPGLVTPEKAERGKLPTDVWWHTIVSPTGKEKTGYPTQKPKGILRRIIQASSKPGDLVLDFFAGSGTTGAVAAELGRSFILIDKSKEATDVIQKRLTEQKVQFSFHEK